MPALRLMTFNVQMLPWIADAKAGMTNDAPQRADGVADAIEALATDQRPHVIAFNEVFDEDGRQRLKTRLGATWPHIVDKIDDGGVLEDSGLMLFSMLPLLAFPNGETLIKGFFEASAGDDSMSNKGFGAVRVNTPVEGTTIVFTHLQAGYATEDEHRDVRLKQLDQIREAIDGVVGPNQTEWRNVVLVGDLNVRGDSDAASDEWTTVFELATTKLFERLDDGWRTSMHPPGDATDHDRGMTNLNFTTGVRQRLDYQCCSKPVDGNRHLIPHHLRVRIKNASDHFALEGVIQQASPRCTPSDAIDLLGTVPGSSSPQFPSPVRLLPLTFQHDGSYQWVWVERPGTFTVFPAPGVRHELYAFDDLSHPLQRLDSLNAAELPPEITARLRETKINPKGDTYVSRSPFFVAFRTSSGAPASSTSAIVEHRGESPATAIWLRLHDEVESGFPSNQRLGADDLCWFKALPAPSYAGKARDEEFTVHNQTGTSIRLTTHDPALDPVDSRTGAGPELQFGVSTPGDELLLFSLARSDDAAVGFRVHWYSPQSYLVLDEPLGLYVDDESGADWNGDDEIIMSMSIDGDTVLDDATWDDADTGERWPQLATTIKQKLWLRLPGVPRIGFHQDLSLSYVEDDFTAQGFQLASLVPLGRMEPGQRERRVNMPVPDGWSDGRYTFYCTISKFP